MVIEWLKIKVVAELREKYIQQDEAIWTAALSQYPGFLAKQVWLSPRHEDEVVLVIHWASKEAWKEIPESILQATEEKFKAALGEGTYRIIEEGEYQVRKFPQGN